MNPHDSLVKGDTMSGRFNFISLAVGGPPMVHITRSFRPEVVIFGPIEDLKLPLSIEAGKSIVINGRQGAEVTVSRFAVGEADQKRVVPNKLDDVIRAIVELDGTYPDVVQFLQQAKSSGAMTCRLEVDALPNPNRHASQPKGGRLSRLSGGNAAAQFVHAADASIRSDRGVKSRRKL